jgi:hypothetical protein
MPAKANRLGNLPGTGRERNPAIPLHKRLSGLKWVDFVNSFATPASLFNHFGNAPMRHWSGFAIRHSPGRGVVRRMSESGNQRLGLLRQFIGQFY